MPADLNRLSAVELAAQLQSRALSAEQVVRACLARIAQRDGEIHAWAHIDPEYALAQARSLDAGPILGPLHGVPLGVKDIFDTADLPTSYGSPIYEGNRPAQDAAAVALCRAAGAVVLGKTVTTEFASYQRPATRNPWHTAYTPGGSSSGSAASVADAMTPLALGTQTAGSIIRPAAYCGIVGFKPSFGAVPSAGCKALADSLDTLGGFGRSIDDVALLASVLMREPALATARRDTAPRVGMYRSLHWRHAAPETRDAFALAAERLREAGVVVVDTPLPDAHCALMQLQADIMAYESVGALAFERWRHADRLSPALAAILDGGARITREQHLANLAQAAEIRGRVERLFGDCDVLLTPSATGEAPFADQGTGDPLFCRLWTLLGSPCIHLPFAKGPQGLPVGLQAIGHIGRDVDLMAAARWVHPLLQEQ